MLLKPKTLSCVCNKLTCLITKCNAKSKLSFQADILPRTIFLGKNPQLNFPKTSMTVKCFNKVSINKFSSYAKLWFRRYSYTDFQISMLASQVPFLDMSW